MSDTFEIRLKHLDGYRFEVDFSSEGVPALQTDEPPPLGSGTGPNPARMLAAAVGNCLASSLLFCLQRSRAEVSGLDVRVQGHYKRNERKRLRIGGLEVHLELSAPESSEALQKCLGLFEDFCVVTASVRRGIPVTVLVERPGGEVLFRSDGRSDED